MKPVTHAFALGLYRRVPTEGSCNRLFSCLPLHRTPRDSRGRKWGRSEQNRELSKGQQCHPVQIRKSLRGWPHQEAWGLTKVSILIPFIGGESSLTSQTVGRGGLWVKLSDGGLNA